MSILKAIADEVVSHKLSQLYLEAFSNKREYIVNWVFSINFLAGYSYLTYFMPYYSNQKYFK